MLLNLRDTFTHVHITIHRLINTVRTPQLKRKGSVGEKCTKTKQFKKRREHKMLKTSDMRKNNTDSTLAQNDTFRVLCRQVSAQRKISTGFAD